MKIIGLILSLFIVSCYDFDMENDVIFWKERYSKDLNDSTCIFSIKKGALDQSKLEFRCPCSWYDVGDSLSKYHRRAINLNNDSLKEIK